MYEYLRCTFARSPNQCRWNDTHAYTSPEGRNPEDCTRSDAFVLTIKSKRDDVFIHVNETAHIVTFPPTSPLCRRGVPKVPSPSIKCTKSWALPTAISTISVAVVSKAPVYPADLKSSCGL
jgi:hypothetical protein